MKIPSILTTIGLAGIAFTAVSQAETPAPAPSSKASASQDCTSCALSGVDVAAQPTLKIRWKRSVDKDGLTVAAHAGGEKELDLAAGALQQSLKPLGVEVLLEKAAVTPEQLAKNPLNSNRIWMNGAALSSYLPESKAGAVRDEESAPVSEVGAISAG